MDARSSLLPADMAGLVVLASVVAVDPGGWYPFVVAKFTAVALTVVGCWWVAASETDHATDRSAFRLFVALVTVLSIAAVFGRDPFYAWTGTPERHLGILTWLLFLASFVAGARLVGPERLARFARWIVVAGLALGTYTLIERWHPLIETTSDSVRLGGPYGSASFLGAALCLTMPVGIAACVGEESTIWRWAAAVSTALGSAALIGSGTRAAWLALTVGAVALLVACRPSRRMLSRWVTPAGAVAVGVALSLGTSSSVAERTGGASSRLDEWAVGLRIVARHPWLGVGPEGYRAALADGVTAGYERTYGRAVLPDRAHNVFIDVAAAGGVFALALYVGLVVLIVVAAWRVLRTGSGVHVGLAAAAIVYLVQQCFLFPVATIDPAFWLIAGAVLAMRPQTDPPESTEVEVEAHDRAPRRWAAAIAIPSIVVVFAVGVVSLAADRAARDAVESSSLAAAERAVTLRPDVARYRLLAAELAPRTIAGYDDAVAAVERARELTPHDPIVEQRLADVLTQRAIASGDAADRGEAVAAWRQLAAADANCYACHLGLGYAAALSGEIAQAVDAFGVAAELEADGTTEAADALRGLTELTDRTGTDSDG